MASATAPTQVAAVSPGPAKRLVSHVGELSVVEAARKYILTLDSAPLPDKAGSQKKCVRTRYANDCEQSLLTEGVFCVVTGHWSLSHG